MNDIVIIGVLLINAIILIRNSYLIITKKIEPSLAMWLFFSIAVSGTLVSYLLEGDHSPLDNILNTSDVVLCIFLTGMIFFFGGKEASFNRFDLFCLSIVILILVLWGFSRAHFAANLSLQMIQIVAYVPVYYRMIRKGRNTESFLTWTLILSVSLLSLFNAKGALAVIYSVRAIICVGLLLALMLLLQIKVFRAKGVIRK